MNCDICGKEDTLFRAMIEGTMMNACKSCASYGEIKGKVLQASPNTSEPAKQEIRKKPEAPVLLIVENFSTLIKNAREHRKQKQEELAKDINEKESLLHSIESGRITPSISLARKLERHLGIKLLQEYHEIEGSGQQEAKSAQMTLADVVVIRKK